MKLNILERLKKRLQPGSEDLAELIKLTKDLKEIRDAMITMKELLSDLEYRQNYHLENEQLKLQLKIAEDMFPDDMEVVKETIELIDACEKRGHHSEKRTDGKTESNDSSLSP